MEADRIKPVHLPETQAAYMEATENVTILPSRMLQLCWLGG